MGILDRLFGRGQADEALPAEQVQAEEQAPQMQRIVCATTFLDGRERYEQGDMRTVTAERASYFIANGWATLPGEAATTGEGVSNTALDIQSVTHKTEVKYG